MKRLRAVIISGLLSGQDQNKKREEKPHYGAMKHNKFWGVYTLIINTLGKFSYSRSNQ